MVLGKGVCECLVVLYCINHLVDIDFALLPKVFVCVVFRCKLFIIIHLLFAVPGPNILTVFVGV